MFPNRRMKIGASCNINMIHYGHSTRDELKIDLVKLSMVWYTLLITNLLKINKSKECSLLQRYGKIGYEKMHWFYQQFTLSYFSYYILKLQISLYIDSSKHVSCMIAWIWKCFSLFAALLVIYLFIKTSSRNKFIKGCKCM